MSMNLQYDLDHRMRAERAVQLIELFAAGGGDGDGYAQVVAALALTQLNGGRVKHRVKFFGNHRDGVHQSVHFVPHYFDGKLGGILNQGLFVGV
jgi:hypothetical protein